MTLEDIKVETEKAYEKECVYISHNQYSSTNCVSDRCFYWNDLDTRIILANRVFSHTAFATYDGNTSAYVIEQGVLKLVTKNQIVQEITEAKEIENPEKKFKEIVGNRETDIYYDTQKQLFMQHMPRQNRVGYCMKVAKELGLV